VTLNTKREKQADKTGIRKYNEEDEEAHLNKLFVWMMSLFGTHGRALVKQHR
jgi:hypothetical protein